MSVIENLDEFGVRIRVITESQPDARLDRLLNRMKFDDAEIFAKQFNLDMQKVHKSRVNYMLSTLACCDHMEREAFNVFMHYLDLIQDHNWVTEICIAGVTLCRSFEYMSDLLCYVEKRDITDEETLERLSRLRYNLSSYRMLYGPKASFLEDSAWSKFIEDNEWKEIFLHFCDRGYFTEAQIVWQRYLKEMRDWMRDEVDIFQQIIDIIQLVISVDITKLWSALELLETAVLPIALTRDADSTISICVVWLKSLASYLESHHPSEYPTNALNALSILQRVMRSMIQHAITPSEMAEVAYTLLKTRVDSEDCEDFMGQLNVYVKNLKEMKKLKEVYQCPMTYDKFTSETVESICFLMLERVRSVHLIRDNMERFAKPYMQSRLRYECDFAALAQIMIQYTIHLETLKLCVRSKSMFSNVVEFVFREVEVQSDPMKRLEDALTIFALQKALLIKCLSQMEEAERMKVIRNILVHVTVAVNSPVTNRNNELRSRKIAAAICILERFAQKTERDRELLIKLRAIRCLHCKYSLTVSLDTFENDRQKVRLLKEYIAEKWNANAPQMWIELIFVYDTMRRVISSLILVCPPNYAQLQLALNIATFVEMFNELITQCLTDELYHSAVNGDTLSASAATSKHKQSAESSLASHSAAVSGTDIMWCMDSLIGVYSFKSDGQIYDRLGAVRAVARIARSVIAELDFFLTLFTSLVGARRKFGLSIFSEMAKKDTGIQADWTGFLGFLSVNNQNLMELCARLFFARLQCFDENIAQFSSNLEQCIGALCERIVVSSPADLWLGAIALLHLPAESLQPALERLRRWATSRKSPEAMIAFLRICQCAVLCRQLSDRNMLATLEQYYARSIWTRKLSDFGATLPQQITPYSVVNEFVSARIPIAVLNR
ncbi:unnamed protein product [Anisakis simplex]|uniref:TPR_REGION domain-containing protein n=1 Tax=Anisakis simplex TaxID=6269 RepID=A0A0M3K6U3_ANISI|nr:unnamed protein product [Anisakis simplex]